jgi:hypothetical protein
VELQLLIEEAKNLDSKYQLPQVVLNVGLQENKYKELFEQLQILVETYDEVLKDLLIGVLRYE